MKRSYCNPLDLGYRYQHMMENGKRIAYREAADPTLIYFKGVYYLFASMSGGFWHSSDLTDWKYHTNRNLLIYDYAPDVRVVGDWMYVTASGRGEACDFYRTKDPINGPYEKVEGVMDYCLQMMMEESIFTGGVRMPLRSGAWNWIRRRCIRSERKRN